MMIIKSNVRGLRRLFPVASLVVLLFWHHSKISIMRKMRSVPPPRFITLFPICYLLGVLLALQCLQTNVFKSLGSTPCKHPYCTLNSSLSFCFLYLTKIITYSYLFYNFFIYNVSYWHELVIKFNNYIQLLSLKLKYEQRWR